MYKVHQSFSIIHKALHQLHASIRDSRGSEGNTAGWWCCDDDDDDVTLLHRARQGHQGLNDGVSCGEPHICRKGQSKEDNVILLRLNHQLWIQVSINVAGFAEKLGPRVKVGICLVGHETRWMTGFVGL